MNLAADPLYQRIRRAFVSDLHRIDAGFDPSPTWRYRGDWEGRKVHPHYARHYDKWSAAEDERCIELLRAGWSPSYVAGKLKRSRRAVWRRMNRLRKRGAL